MSLRSRAHPWWSDKPRRATNAHNRTEAESYEWGWFPVGQGPSSDPFNDGLPPLPLPHEMLDVQTHWFYDGVAVGWDWGSLWRELRALVTTDWTNEVFLGEPRRRVPPAAKPPTPETFLSRTVEIPPAFFANGWCRFGNVKRLRAHCFYCLGYACERCARNGGSCGCSDEERHSRS